MRLEAAETSLPSGDREDRSRGTAPGIAGEGREKLPGPRSCDAAAQCAIRIPFRVIVVLDHARKAVTSPILRLTARPRFGAAISSSLIRCSWRVASWSVSRDEGARTAAGTPA